MIERDFITFIAKDIVNKKREYGSVVNLPLSFYNSYKDYLMKYKDRGMTKDTMKYLLTELYTNNEEIEDFVFEILDLVCGYCSPNYKIFD